MTTCWRAVCFYSSKFNFIKKNNSIGKKINKAQCGRDEMVGSGRVSGQACTVVEAAVLHAALGGLTATGERLRRWLLEWCV